MLCLKSVILAMFRYILTKQDIDLIKIIPTYSIDTNTPDNVIVSVMQNKIKFDFSMTCFANQLTSELIAPSNIFRNFKYCKEKFNIDIVNLTENIREGARYAFIQINLLLCKNIPESDKMLKERILLVNNMIKHIKFKIPLDFEKNEKKTIDILYLQVLDFISDALLILYDRNVAVINEFRKWFDTDPPIWYYDNDINTLNDIRLQHFQYINFRNVKSETADDFLPYCLLENTDNVRGIMNIDLNSFILDLIIANSDVRIKGRNFHVSNINSAAIVKEIANFFKFVSKISKKEYIVMKDHANKLFNILSYISFDAYNLKYFFLYQLKFEGNCKMILDLIDNIVIQYLRFEENRKKENRKKENRKGAKQAINAIDTFINRNIYDNTLSSRSLKKFKLNFNAYQKELEKLFNSKYKPLQSVLHKIFGIPKEDFKFETANKYFQYFYNNRTNIAKTFCPSYKFNLMNSISSNVIEVRNAIAGNKTIELFTLQSEFFCSTISLCEIVLEAAIDKCKNAPSNISIKKVMRKTEVTTEVNPNNSSDVKTKLPAEFLEQKQDVPANDQINDSQNGNELRVPSDNSIKSKELTTEESFAPNELQVVTVVAKSKRNPTVKAKVKKLTSSEKLKKQIVDEKNKNK